METGLGHYEMISVPENSRGAMTLFLTNLEDRLETADTFLRIVETDSFKIRNK
jgi:hypothetical protein